MVLRAHPREPALFRCAECAQTTLPPCLGCAVRAGPNAGRGASCAALTGRCAAEYASIESGRGAGLLRPPTMASSGYCQRRLARKMRRISETSDPVVI